MQKLRVFSWLGLIMGLAVSVFAQTPAPSFTYQGRLNLNGSAVTGTNQIMFVLTDASAGNGSFRLTNVLNNVPVNNGVFTVQLDFGAQFTGADRWLEIAVRTNALASYTFLAPRQKVLPTPYAMFATEAHVARIATGVAAASVNNAALLPSAVNSVTIQDGTVSSADLAPQVLDNTFWRLNGNSGTTPGVQFLGTTDGQRLELRVNNQRGLVIVPAVPGLGMVNVIGGSESNRATGGGATIAGGGSHALRNHVLNDFGTVGGGAGNSATGFEATIAGGRENIAGGLASTVGGGKGNRAENDHATVAGGEINIATALWSTISGGGNNSIPDGASGFGLVSTISGGYLNRIAANGGAVGGGYENTVHRGADYTVIGGGAQNIIGTNAFQSTIGGGGGNKITVGGAYGTVPGGLQNEATNAAFAAGTRAKAIHRGAFVWSDATPGDFASTSDNQFLIRAGGGVGINTTNPQAPLHVYSGNNPAVVRVQSTGTPGFGRLEFLSNPQGDINEWRPGYVQSTDAGGFTGGLAFVVNGTGAANKFGEVETMRLQNGRVGIGNTAPGTLLQVGNATCNGTTWANASDRNIKSEFQSVDPGEMLEKVAVLPVRTWSYTNDPGTRHIGPTAQDFKAAFHVGSSDRSIATVDMDGVALAAIQGLNKKLREKELRIEELEKRLAAIELLLGQ